MSSDSTLLRVVDDLTPVDIKPMNEFRSSNGIVFKLKKVSQFVVMEAGRKIPLPKMPKIFNEDKGREIENPLDPEYLDAKERVAFQQGMIACAVYTSLGSEVIALPDGIQPADSEGWATDLIELGLDIPEKGRSRYVAWLKYYALPGKEFGDLTEKIAAYSGQVLEVEVGKAEESFRG